MNIITKNNSPNSNYKLKYFKSIIYSLVIASLLTGLAGFSPLDMVRALFSTAYGCKEITNCAFLTTLQFATPLIFSGLSAVIAFRSGFFSIGQAGQMVLGAGFASWVGYQIYPQGIHPIIAIAVAGLVGAIWGILPVFLKYTFYIHEIISSFILNSIAGLLIGLLPLSWNKINETARLSQLAVGSKLNAGLILAIFASISIYLYFWYAKGGFRLRMVGEAPNFSAYAGINAKLSTYKAMMISGAIAGMGGAVEVLGVHYKFISGFSASVNFDGIMTALLAQGHPIGVIFSGLFVGGIRLGSLNGLLIKEGIPREIGNTILAIMMILISVQQFSNMKNKY